MVSRCGVLVRPVPYLVWKQHLEGGGDERFVAPTGCRVVWGGKTNEGFEKMYGGETIFWVVLPDFGGGSVGVVLGTDFVWVGEG